MKKLSLCDSCKHQGWFTGFSGSYRICMCDWDNSKEEPEEYCPDYKYDRETLAIHREYYKNENETSS